MKHSSFTATQAKQLILDHYRHPQHRGITSPVDLQHSLTNPICDDQIEISISLNSAQDSIEDIKFQGHGCVICLASADLMAAAVKGKSIAQALDLIQHFQQMLQQQHSFSPPLHRLNALQGVWQYPTKINCAAIAWQTLERALN